MMTVAEHVAIAEELAAAARANTSAGTHCSVAGTKLSNALKSAEAREQWHEAGRYYTDAVSERLSAAQHYLDAARMCAEQGDYISKVEFLSRYEELRFARDLVCALLTQELLAERNCGNCALAEDNGI